MSAPIDVAGILERAGADPNAPEGSQAWALAQVGVAFAGLVEAATQANALLELIAHILPYGEPQVGSVGYNLRAALAAVGGVR